MDENNKLLNHFVAGDLVNVGRLENQKKNRELGLHLPLLFGDGRG